MANLVSPGVSVTIVDESFYGTTGPGTIPLIVFATAENKPSPTGTGLAPSSLTGTANQLTLVTSQRELIQSFGAPSFYVTEGTPFHGDELNEYGLHAAYSYLSISNQVYCVRAPIDLSQLQPNATAPTGLPVGGTYWLDLTNTVWGIFQSNGNASPGLAWNSVTPSLVINSTAQVDSNNVPLNSLGTTGQFAVVTLTTLNIIYQNLANPLLTTTGNTASSTTISALPTTNGLAIGMSVTGSGIPVGTVITAVGSSTITISNAATATASGVTLTFSTTFWYEVGSAAWKSAQPTVLLGTTSNPLLTIGNAIVLNSTVITLAGTSAGSLVTQINTAAIPNITASLVNGALQISNTAGQTISIANSSGTPLTTLGITAGSYKGVTVIYGPHTSVPSNSISGDIWLKTTNPNKGANWVVNVFSSATNSFVNVPAPLNSTPPAQMTAGTGIGQLYVQYSSDAFVSIFNAGTGYTNGTYIATAIGGTGTTPATFSVTVSSNIVTAVSILNSGVYSIYPPNPISVTGLLNGSNATFSVNPQGSGTLFRWNGVAWAALNESTTPVALSYEASLTTPTTSPATGTFWYNSVQTADVMYNNGVNWVGYKNQFPSTDPGGVIFAGSAPIQQSSGSPLADQDIWVNTSDLDNYPNISRWNASQQAWVTIDKTDHTTPFGMIFADARQSSGRFGFIAGASIAVAGSGYTNGFFTATVQGGTATVPATLSVTVAGGAVTTVTVLNQGTYSVYPTNPVSVTGIPSGINASFNLLNTGTYTQFSTAISQLLASNFVDPDAPVPTLFPAGMLLFNTRYSTNNVKQWEPNWFKKGPAGTNFETTTDFSQTTYTVGGTYTFPALIGVSRWVTASGNDAKGVPLMGRKAQRIMVVRAIQTSVSGNQDILSEVVNYNLIACPGYPELIGSMDTLNVNVKQRAFIVGDTPIRLAPDGTSVQNWATNSKNSAGDGEDGLVTHDPYIGVYYPWGLSTDPTNGNDIMVPPSTIILRTIAFNDQVAYPWFAPAGFQRGLVSNANSVGYLLNGEFTPLTLNQGQRDVLYTNNINPIAFIPSRGLVVFGQKTLNPVSSALDRVNVARLANYLNYNLDQLVRPFLFEPNDSHTRSAAQTTVERFLMGLVGLRALGDFAVVCDTTNNTPARIDLNQLWIDIFIQPLKAVEFIFVPIRITNTGAVLQ